MKARYIVPVFLFLFICTAINSFAQDAPKNPVVEKMSELEWHIGKWKQKGTWLPNGNEVTSIINCQWRMGKTTIMCEYSEVETPDKVTSFSVISYDQLLNNYVSTSFYSMVGRPIIGNMINNGESWSMQGEIINTNFKVWNNMMMTPNDGIIEIAQYRSTNGGVVEKVQEATLTRMD